jgi:hypothetical protein
MTLPAYDIFKEKGGQLVWVEIAQDLESATKRIEGLAKQDGCEYVVVDQSARRIVASRGHQLFERRSEA